MRLLLAACAFVLHAGLACAQNYPVRAIKVIVPFPAGGSSDIIARVIADPLGHELGQPVYVENVPGAGGSLGTLEASRSPADGYTLAIGTGSTLVVYGATRARPRYTVEDFIPISEIASMPNVVVVNNDFPARDLRDFIRVLKAHPGRYSFGSAGVGTVAHMLAESFESGSGTELVHVPYKGSGFAIQDLIGGRIDMVFDQFPSSKPYIDSGRVRLIGVIAPQRIAGYGAMTMQEVGLDLDDEVWCGLLAPAGVSRDIIARLSTAMHEVMASEGVRSRLERLGASPAWNSPARFKAQIGSEIRRMKQLVQARHIRLDD